MGRTARANKASECDSEKERTHRYTIRLQLGVESPAQKWLNYVFN